jgi:hypothetical protein
MSMVSVKVGVESMIETGLEKVREQFHEFREELNSDFANFFAFEAVKESLEQVLEKAAEIQHISDRFGVPAEELQRVTNAAKENGATMEDVAGAWNRLTVNMAEAIRGNEVLRQHFANLGISMEEVTANAGNTSEMFYRVANAVAAAKNDGMAYDDVIKLMGRSSGVMFSTLKEGAGTIKEVGDSFGVMSDETVAKLDKVHIELEKLSNQVQIGLGGALVWVASYLGAMTALFTGLGMSAISIFVTMGSAIKDVLHGNLIAATNDLANWSRDVGAIMDATHQTIDDIWAGPGDDKKTPAPVTDGEDPSEKHSADEKVRLQKELDDLRAKGVADSLEGEQKINELWRQRQEWLDKAAGETDDDSKLKDQIEVEKLGQEATRLRAQADAEATRKKEQQAKEEERAQQRLAELTRQDAVDSADSARGKLGVLLEQWTALQAQLDVETDVTKQRELQVELAEQDKLIAQERRTIAEEDQRKSEELDKLRRENSLDAMTKEQRSKVMRDEVGQLTGQIAKESDPSKKLDLQLKQQEDIKELIALSKESAMGKKADHVAADHLQQIGGGGRAASAGLDRHLEEARRQTALLQQLVKQTATSHEGGSGHDDIIKKLPML